MTGARLAPGAIAVRAGDEVVVWVESTGALHLLDPVAASVLQLLDGSRSEGDVCASLGARFAADPSSIAHDVRRLVDGLTRSEVLTPAPR